MNGYYAKNISAKIQLKNSEELQELLEKATFHNKQLRETLQSLKNFNLET